jgi:hypothetical protein
LGFEVIYPIILRSKCSLIWTGKLNLKAKPPTHSLTIYGLTVLPVNGTAIRGNLITQNNVFSSKPVFDSVAVKTGKTISGEWVNKIPNEIGIDMGLMRLW